MPAVVALERRMPKERRLGQSPEIVHESSAGTRKCSTFHGTPYEIVVAHMR